MKMTKRIALGLSLAGLLCACQGNNSKIDGKAEGYNDGDSLFVWTSDEHNNTVYLDTAVIKDGRFTVSIPADQDSVQLCTLSDKDKEANVFFFREPGNIEITISKHGQQHVGGTKANDAWQEMAEKQLEFEQEIDALTKSLTSSNLDENQQKEIQSKLEALQTKMVEDIISVCAKNLDNEFGYFITTQLGANGMIPDDRLNSMLDQMDDKYKNRQDYLSLKKALEDAQNTDVGKTIANYLLQTPNDTDFMLLDSIKGNELTVLDFWASWCGPCRQEMPFMKNLLDKYQDRGFGIIGISLDRDGASWKDALLQLKLAWPQAVDDKQQCSHDFRITGIPYTVVVDRQGTILAKELRGKELENFIVEHLPSKEPAKSDAGKAGKK